jgi:hypothetical protein
MRHARGRPQDEETKGRVEIRERLAAARLREALVERPLQQVEALRVHPDGDQAVGDFGAALDAGRADRRRVDLHVLAAVQDALQRLAEAGGPRPRVGNLIVLALELERRLARQDLSDDADVLARARERLAIRHTVPALDHLRARRAGRGQRPPDIA